MRNLRNTSNQQAEVEWHARIYHSELECPAYRTLSVYARSLLIEIRSLYNGTNNGEIGLSTRKAAERLNCCQDTAIDAFHELIKKGWIVETWKGAYRNNPKARLASEYRLTNVPTGPKNEVPATCDYFNWRPTQKNDEDSPQH